MGIADILLHSSWFLFWVSVSEIHSKWVETSIRTRQTHYYIKKDFQVWPPSTLRTQTVWIFKESTFPVLSIKVPSVLFIRTTIFHLWYHCSAFILMLIWFRQKNMHVFHMFCKESNTYLKKNDLGSDQEYIWLEQLIAQPFLHTCIYPNDRTPSVIVAE